MSAGAALRKLYADWEANGGVAPDTYDENVAVALDLGLDPLDRDDPELTRIWEAAQDGLDDTEVAALHERALRAKDSREFEAGWDAPPAG